MRVVQLPHCLSEELFQLFKQAGDPRTQEPCVFLRLPSPILGQSPFPLCVSCRCDFEGHSLSSHGWLVSLAQCLLRLFTWWHATTPFFFSASCRPRCDMVHPCRRRLANTALIPLPSFYSTNVKGWSCCVFCDPIGVPRKWWQGRHHSLLMFSASLFWCLAYAWE